MRCTFVARCRNEGWSPCCEDEYTVSFEPHQFCSQRHTLVTNSHELPTAKHETSTTQTGHIIHTGEQVTGVKDCSTFFAAQSTLLITQRYPVAPLRRWIQTPPNYMIPGFPCIRAHPERDRTETKAKSHMLISSLQTPLNATPSCLSSDQAERRHAKGGRREGHQISPPSSSSIVITPMLPAKMCSSSSNKTSFLIGLSLLTLPFFFAFVTRPVLTPAQSHVSTVQRYYWPAPTQVALFFFSQRASMGPCGRVWVCEPSGLVGVLGARGALGRAGLGAGPSRPAASAFSSLALALGLRRKFSMAL
jgi:hypothetical protein